MYEMYERIIAHMPGVIEGFLGSVLFFVCAAVLALAQQQLKSFWQYLLASRKVRRRQNFVKLWWLIKNDNYLILMDQRHNRAQFLTIFSTFSVLLLMIQELPLVLIGAPSIIFYSGLLLTTLLVLVVAGSEALLWSLNDAARRYRMRIRRRGERNAVMKDRRKNPPRFGTEHLSSLP
jgi:hypothetical protein